jgi:hypothetical protein
VVVAEVALVAVGVAPLKTVTTKKPVEAEAVESLPH